MSWRDQIQDGSFRGAAFVVTESRAQFGRRNAVHEYPQRDKPWAEDMGRAARRWTIECFVIGDDYFADRDALVSALEGKGPGTLVHPYLGTVQASLESPGEITETTAEGGMATFSLQFVEAGADTSPSATPDTQALSTAAASALQTVAITSLTNNLDLVAQPAFVTNAAGGLLSKAGSEISAALGAVQTVADGLTEAQQTIQGLVNGGLQLLQAPEALVDQVFTAVGAIGDLAATAEDALGQLVGPLQSSTGLAGGLLAFGSDLPAVSGSTPARLAQASNQVALAQLVRCAAAAAAVNVVADTPFTSYDDAVGIRDPLADQLDGLALAIADGGDDDLADAVDAVRLAMIADVTARGASLARLYTYTPATTEPALVIAQRLYGDATRVDDILARNPQIQNPGFVSGPLEVLSDA